MDVDWEYPVQRADGSLGDEQDKQNFVLLLQELKNVLGPAGKLVTIAVGSTQKIGDISYDIPGIVNNVDFINLMTYDFHGAWDNTAGINSPLFSGDSLNVDASVKYWLDKGCPKEKLIVGVPTYGRSFTLQDPGQNGVGAPVSGGGNAGPWTRQAGMLGYNEITVNGWPEQWQDDQKVPYAFQDNQWVGYDNPKSAQEKANYVISNGLGGCMFWSIETDDFRKGNPIMTAVSQLMRDPGYRSKQAERTERRTSNWCAVRPQSFPAYKPLEEKDKKDSKLQKASEKARSKLSSCFPCL